MNRLCIVVCLTSLMFFPKLQAQDPPDWIQQLPTVSQVTPVSTLTDLDFSAINEVQYASLVHQAKAGVRELLGPMDSAQEKKFNATWTPMFDYPAQECLDYLQQVIPLVEQTVRLRAALIQHLQEYQSVWDQAGYAVAYSEEAGEMLMQEVAREAASIRSIQAALEQATTQLEALGDPPQPGALKNEASRRYHRAMANLERLLGIMPPLEGGYERTGLVSFSYYGDDINQPCLSRIPVSDTLVEEVYKAWRVESDGLVLVYNYTETTSDGPQEEGLFSFLDNEPEEWWCFYAEPSDTGWATYSYDEDEEEVMVTATFYRPDGERLIVDSVTLVNGRFDDATHTTYDRKPVEQIGKAYPTGESEQSIGKMIDEAGEDLQEARGTFLKGRAAFGQYLQNNGFMPDMPDADQLYWVLKDVRLTQAIDDQRWITQTDWEEVVVTPTEVKADETSLKISWEKKTTQYEMRAGSSSLDKVQDNQAFIVSPDDEDVGAPPMQRVVSDVKTESFAVDMHWETAPAVVRDGGYWAMHPTGQGTGTWAIDGLFDLEHFELMGRSLSLGGLGSSYLLSETEPDPERDIDIFGGDNADHLKSFTCDNSSIQRECYLQLRCSEIHGDQSRFVIPIVAASEGGAIKVDFIYSLQALDEDTADAMARSHDIPVETLDLSRKIDQEAVAQQAAEQEAQQERVALHQANIAYCRQTIDRLQADATALQEQLKSGQVQASDIERLNQLRFMITCQQSNLMAEQDRITELQTGQPTFRRTPFDEMCRAQVVHKAEIEARKADAAARALKKAHWLTRKLDVVQRRKAYELIDKCIQNGGATEPAAWGQLNHAMQNIYQGEQALEMAKIEEDIAWKQAQLDAVQNIKTGADVGMTLLPMAGGPMAVAIAYQTGCGYVEGGIWEGVKRGVTTYSDAADVAVSAYDGWQAGGWWGMVESASVSLLMNKGPEVALGRLKMRTSGGFDGGYGEINIGKAHSGSGKIDADVPTRTTVSSRGAEAIEAAKFQQEMEYGKALGDDFFSAHARLRTAEIKGTATKAELDAMRMEVRQKAAAVAHSMPAKSYLKYGAPPAKGKAYSETMDDILGDAVAAYNWEMRSRGYNEQTLFHCRNASSTGAGMDADLALKQQPDTLPIRGDDGSVTYQKNNWLTQNGEPVSLIKYQKEGSEVLAQAYKKVSGGYSAKQSFIDMTTSIHPESYPDLMWLSVPKPGAHADIEITTQKLDSFFGQVDPGKLPENLGVTTTKAEIMFKEHPELRKLGSMMETCRGTAKDLDTKFIPLVESKIRKIESIEPGKRTPTDIENLKELRNTHQQLTECKQCFNEIGKGEIPPYEWRQRFRTVTGGQDAVAVTKRLAKITEMAGQL